MKKTSVRTKSARIWFRLGFASYQVKSSTRVDIREVPLGFQELIPSWCWTLFQDEAEIRPKWAKMGAKIGRDGARMGEDGAKIGQRYGQDGAKIEQDGAKMEPGWAKMGLRLANLGRGRTPF